MVINVSVAATVVCGIAFSAPGGALQAEFGASLAGGFRHKLLRKSLRGTLLVADDGVEFLHERCAHVDLDSFDLPAKESTLNSNQNRPRQELVRHP
jgi:hypothetical protein